MRVVLLLAALIASASAAECTSNAFVCKFKEIGANIKDAASALGGQLLSVGQALLGQVIQKGSEILTGGSKAIVGALNDHLGKLGKREIQLPQKVLDLIEQGKTFLQSIGAGLKGNLKDTIGKLLEVYNKVVDLDISDKITTDVDKAVEEFKGKASNALSMIKQGVESVLGRVLGETVATSSKRGISDLLSGAASALKDALKTVTDALSPHVQTVIGHVTNLGNSIKDQASTLIDQVKQSVSDLGGKLSGHVSTLADHGKVLVQHGKDALAAAADALSQIAAQTLNNAKDTIAGAVSVSKDAVGVIVDHVQNNGY